MPTPSEQKALAFIAIVILLGGAVRVVRAGSTPVPTQAEQQGITRQARASDSAAKAHAEKSRSKGRARKPRASDTLTHDVGGVASVPPSFARPDQPYAKSPYGYPPPGPRIDVDNRPKPPAPAVSGGDAAPLDIDRATAEQIEKLPRIGPAMARRIVANRDSLGPFKTIEGLRRVRGIGPAMAAQLKPLIVFNHR